MFACYSRAARVGFGCGRKGGREWRDEKGGKRRQGDKIGEGKEWEKGREGGVRIGRQGRK